MSGTSRAFFEATVEAALRKRGLKRRISRVSCKGCGEEMMIIERSCCDKAGIKRRI